MLNIEEINNTITELENGSTTYDSCNKLASLYIVREYFNTDIVVKEYKDILPQYHKYTDIKRKYQLGETTESSVLNAMDSVCLEMREFIQTVYSGTDMEQERDAIKHTLIEILEKM